MTSALTRRSLIVTSVAAGGMLVAFPLWAAEGAPPPTPATPATPPPPPASAFIRILPKGPIVLIMPRAEMGQGAYTTCAMLLAEELEVGLDQVRLEAAPPNAALYSDPINGEQVTGTSATTMAWFDPLRTAGATTRMLLIAAAAKRWKVSPIVLHADRGAVVHNLSGRRAPYGELAAAAAKLKVPKDVPLKPADKCALLGKPIQRVDQVDKVTGAAQFGIDVRLPGMLVATVAACPAFGGRLRSVDDKPALAVKGVRQVVRLPDAVAVVADHMGAAIKGLRALSPEWDLGPGAADSSATIAAAMARASAGPAVVGLKTGDTTAAMAGAAKRIDALYQMPLLAHAPMEPINCTVHVRGGEAEVWTGTQAPVRAREAAAKGAGVPVEKVTVHNQLLGGGFGRRLYVDHVAQAAAIARQVKGPVKVVWTREEDIRHDHYRPCYYDRLTGGLDASGRVVAWTHRTCASAVSYQWDPTSLKDGLDPDAVDTAAGPYDFANVLADYVRVEPGQVPTGWWRGVGPTHNLFMVESFMDELAALAGADPLAFRQAHLSGAPRAAAVLRAAAKAAGWGTPLPKGRGRGISVSPSFGSFLAEVAEVTVGNDGVVKVDKVTCAVDCGRTVNPDGIRAQVEGGINFGLTAALWGEVTLDKGQIVQSNFGDYRPMRIGEAPAVETVILESSEAPGGIGEPPCSAAAPALANAIFAATGRRIRKLPIAEQLKT
jgi:isoquinoline 1-oxidoreductase beta subunit